MRLWAVYNGYRGEALVCALVEADTEAQALAKAPEVFATDRYQADDEGYCEPIRAEVIELPALVELG